MRGKKWFIKLSLTSLIALVGCGEKLPLQQSIEKTDSAIFGGRLVDVDDPLGESIVAVYDAFLGQLCTGVLVSKNVVLTAAHCIGLFTDEMFIFFESEITETSVPFPIDKAEISPYWPQRKFEHLNKGDIALVRFVGTLPANKRPVMLLTAAKFQRMNKGDSVVVAGYGLSDGTKGEGAGTLRTATLTIDSKDFSASEVLLDQTQGKGSCHGDSGGPVFSKIGDRHYLLGIISRGVDDKDNDCTRKAALTQIFFHKTWMSRMIQKLSTSILDPLAF